MLNSSNEMDIFVLFLLLEGKPSYLSPLSVIVAVDFLQMPFISLVLVCQVFHHEDFFPNAFSVSIKMITWFLPFLF